MAISNVEYASNTGGSVSTLGITFTVHNAFAELGVVGLSHDADPGAYSGPAGWTQIGSTLPSVGISTPNYLSLWYAKSTGDGTWTWSWANPTNIAIVGGAYKGHDTSSPLDQSATNTGNGSTLTSSSVTTTSASELLAGVFGVAALSVGSATFSAATGSFALQVQNSTSANVAASALNDRFVSSTGTYSTGLTSSLGGNWGSILATFKAAAAAPPPPLVSAVIRPWQDDTLGYPDLIECF